MPLRVLHLSDIHFSTKFEEEKIVHTDVRDELLSDLRDVMIPRLEGVDKVLIAGDIAFSGKRAEYDEAAIWLEQVTSACRCQRTDVLTVPGNHDVDRGRILPVTKVIHRRLRTCSLPEAKKELVDIAFQDDGSLTEKLTDYQAFASTYGCQFESPSKPRWNTSVSLENDLLLKFVGLTTVQVCDDEDQKGGLLLGAHQYIVDRNPRAELIVVMHHPPEWFKDRAEAFQYLDSRARVLIFGHEHLQLIQLISNVNQEARLIICSGAVTPETTAAPYIYRYNILEFGLTGHPENPCLKITIHPRVWVPEKTRFDADTILLDGQQSATFSLGCPQFKLAASEAQPAPLSLDADATAKISEGFIRLNYFFWRYLSWQEQLKVLVKIDSLPITSVAPALQGIAHMALDRARKDGKLAGLWDIVMTYVPEAKKESNPFRNS